MPVEIPLPNHLLVEAGGPPHPFDEYVSRRTMRIIITAGGKGFVLLNMKKRGAAVELQASGFSVQGLAFMDQAYWYETYVADAAGARRLLDAAQYLSDILSEREATATGLTFGRPMSDGEQMAELSRTF